MSRYDRSIDRWWGLSNDEYGERAPVRSFDGAWCANRSFPLSFLLPPVVVLSASYQCANSDDRSVLKKSGRCPPVRLGKLLEKVLNNTVGEGKMLRCGNTS